jgi:hypothetical protein
MIRFRRTERPVDASFSLSSLYQAMANERQRETSENALAGGDGLHVAHTARGHAPTACSTLAPPSPNRGRPASALSPCRPAGPAAASPPDPCARGAAQLRPPTRMLQLALAGEIKDNRKEG